MYQYQCKPFWWIINLDFLITISVNTKHDSMVRVCVRVTLKRSASSWRELRMRRRRELSWFDEPRMCLTIHYIASLSATSAPSSAPAHFWGFGSERWEGSPLRSEAKGGGGISETATRSALQPHIQHQGIEESVRIESIAQCSPRRTSSFGNYSVKASAGASVKDPQEVSSSTV